MMEFLLSVLKALVGKIVTDEFNATCPAVAQWLVKRSAVRLGEHRERYEEQWLADLADRGTPLRKLIFAVGICRAAITLRRELAPAARPVQPGRLRAKAAFMEEWHKAARDWGRPNRAETDFPRGAIIRLIRGYLHDPFVATIIIVAAGVVAVGVGFMMGFFEAS